MDQRNIRRHSGTVFAVTEASAWLRELDDRNRSGQTGYNSIDELAAKAKKHKDTHISVFGRGTDNNWKKIIGVSLREGTHVGASFGLEIIQSNGNHGETANIDKYHYTISCSRSSGTQNNRDRAIIYGAQNSYVRVVKVSRSYHEIQVRPEGSHKEVTAVIKRFSSNRATVDYYDSETTSASGTIYGVTTTRSGATDNFLDINANQITCVDITETSDRQFKENIELVNGEWALSIFKKLRFSVYDNRLSLKKDAGLIAQEVEKVLPEAVHTDSNGKRSLNYRYVDTIKSAAIQHFIKAQIQ